MKRHNDRTLKHRRRHRLAALALALALSTAARAAPLDTLYDAPSMDAFFAAATPAAEAGDVDALFLLGKAHHTGKGTPKDVDRAVGYYERARAKGSARAAHNLGLIALDEGRRNVAIGLLNEALGKGLELPTLRNLGRAYTPSHPSYRMLVQRPVEDAGRAGDAYAAAYRVSGSVNDAFDASAQYYRAWFFARNAVGREHETFDHAALRERAVHWLRIGMDADLGAAWTNFGVLLLEEGDTDGARKAFERGVARDVPVAHYHLSGLSRDPDEALDHMERAALLGLESAHQPAQQQLHDRYEHETDLAVLRRAVARMAALRAKSSEPYVRDTLSKRLAWGELVADRQVSARALPDRPARLRVCELDLGQARGDAFNLGANTAWRLVVYTSVDDPAETGVSGRVDARGCASSTGDLPPKVTAALRDGALPALHFPNVTLPLATEADARRITLGPMPQDAPTPDW